MTVSFEIAEARLRERLSEEAVAHSLRVAEAAGLLAAIYGANVENARLAGLLHDWDREQSAEALLQASEVQGRVLDPAERGVPYLLHARTGAQALEDEFEGLPADVLSAVAYHTLGASDMGDLDMIVYVADMIEAGRKFSGVDDLREAVGTVGLRDLFAQAYQQSVAHLVAARKTIHPETVAVWNHYVARPRS